jgi:integrase
MHVSFESAGGSSAPASVEPSGPSRAATRASGTRDGRTPLCEVARLYFAEYTGRDRTRPQRVGYWVDRFGDRPIGDVTDDDVADALDELSGRAGRVYAGKDADGHAVYRAKRRPLSGSTVNRYLSAMSALCTFAVRRRMVPRGWPHPTRDIEKPKENPAKTRFLNREEVARLLEAAKASRWERMHLFILAGIVTGCRRGELLRLKWADVDFAQGMASIAHTKNGRPRLVPLTDELMAELRRFAGKPDALVFPSARKPGQAMNVSEAFRATVKRAGLRGVTPHVLRHSCASFLVANGATLFEVQQVLGHTTTAMSARYSHLSVGHKAGLVRRVLTLENIAEATQ